MNYIEQAEQLIKGAFYFMLKGREGGKYKNRKKVVDPKTGKMRWGGYTYDTPKKSVKQSKPKADNKGMKDNDDIVLLPDDSNEPAKTSSVEEYRKTLFNKSPKYVVGKIVNSDESEGLKILQSFKNRSQKAREFEKNIPKNARVADGEFISAIESGDDKKLKQILSKIRDHKDTLWVD